MKPNVPISPVSTINIYNAFNITMYLVILSYYKENLSA